LSFEADAETLSLFTSLDFDLEDESCQKIVEHEQHEEEHKETERKTEKNDDRTDEDEEEEEEEEEEETAVSLVHSVQQTTGKSFYLLTPARINNN
jgi:hypothetical protein